MLFSFLMDATTLAYCAGVVDSDGCITITRGRGRGGVRLYQPKVFVKQAERPAVELLQAVFGGYLMPAPPSKAGGRPLLVWHICHRGAVAAAARLLRFLRIKKRQAELLQEFSQWVGDYRHRQPIFWFRWQPGEPTVTPYEAAAILGVKPCNIYQAVRCGTIPRRKIRGHVLLPRRALATYTPGRYRTLPAEYTAECERLCSEVQSLNGPTRGFTAAARAAAQAASAKV